MLEFEWGKTEFDARVGDNWVACTPAVGEGSELLVNPRLLDPRQRRQVLMLLPRGADLCRMRVNYQSELLPWRLWRQLGVRGQTFAVSRSRSSVRNSGLRGSLASGLLGERPSAGRLTGNVLRRK